MRALALIAVLAAASGCKDRRSSDDAPKTSAAAGAAGQAGRDAAGAPATPSDDPGIASDHGVAGDVECFAPDRCREACDAKTPGACERLAELLENGWGVEADPEAARAARRGACLESADPAACAHLLRDGDFPAVALGRRCEDKNGRACFVLARQSGYQAIDEPEFAIAEADFDDDACQAGYADSCEVIARATDRAYAKYQSDRSALEARTRSLREADCDAGVAFACASLAIAGDRARAERASVLYRRQCAAGYPPSCLRVIELAGAKRIDLPPEAIAEARERACALGHRDSCPTSSPPAAD